jgi:TonB family protein
MTMAEGWTKEWERRIVNGVYPLRRFLGQSDHSVVFLTECRAQNLAQAAIKILPRDPAHPDAQLEHWRRVASLSHPHLIRVFDAGSCQLGGQDFVFAVMDYAEQNLAQILPSRALTPDEVRDLLPATLDALTYLHGKHLVQGGLKPPNFMVVNDQLKLASDTVRPAGEGAASAARLSPYDPPEAQNGTISSASDIWGLGMTLVEALTQTVPAWSRQNAESVPLPANLAPDFVETIRRCLNRSAGRRPTTAELVDQFKQPPPAMAPAAQSLVVGERSAGASSSRAAPKNKTLIISIMAGVIALAALWFGVRVIRTPADGPPLASTTLQSPVAAPAPAIVPSPRAAGIPAPSPPIVHQELPDVSRHARESIRGVIQIAIRVSVDRSGNVAEAALDNRASSRYFERAAMTAAKQWKFAPAAQGARVWVLNFEFTRAGVAVHATLSR